MPVHAMPASTQPRWTVSVVTAAAQRLLLYTNTAREVEVGISESVAAAAGALGLCKLLWWLLLIASRNTPFLSSSATFTAAHWRVGPPIPVSRYTEYRDTATNLSGINTGIEVSEYQHGRY